ncbi:MAG: hydantoinase/oxoprolinase family protein, partial [Chromatiales bacterium]|nr:hydantoinase/oxoprolinase family protein [Chromatiales bacterium]
MIVGIEVGGTFTDLVLADAEGQLRVHKLPSTPHDPSEAAIQGLKELLADAGAQACDVQELLHGSTIAANALIQRRGAKTALITTRGFRDVLFIQRQDRTTVYDMFYVKPAPLVSRDFVFELNERMGADGEPITSLDETQALALADELVALGVESVAICLLHAYANAAHELQLMNILAERAPNLRVSLSSQVAPEHREYERTSTTVIDAFVGPAVERYLQHYGEQAKALGYARTALIMQSNGGVVPLDRARRLAAGMFVSGPAAAVTAATHVANGANCPDVISVDVGGTSCDVCLIAGGAPRTTGKGSAEFSVDGLPLNVVMTDIATIGAGGGSIAHVDRGGMLQVGPQSAGAAPGPACYGHGGEAFCLTDAMLLLGLLDPERPLPGDIRLAPALAIAAAQPLCEHFGLTPQDLAAQVYRIAVANMAQAMRRVSVTRGFDPRSFALLPCGGAGPLVATALADEVGVDAILLPPHPGILSAFGLAVADVRMDYVKADGAITVESDTCDDIANRLTALREDADTEFTQLGYDSGALGFQFTADVRYLGQGYELRVELAEADFSSSGLGAFLDRFHSHHEQHFGYCARQRA